MVIDLAESRKKIDEIDKEIVRLFQKRMGVATDVAAYKRSTGKKVLDPKREEEKIESGGCINEQPPVEKIVFNTYSTSSSRYFP